MFPYLTRIKMRGVVRGRGCHRRCYLRTTLFYTDSVYFFTGLYTSVWFVCEVTTCEPRGGRGCERVVYRVQVWTRLRSHWGSGRRTVVETSTRSFRILFPLLD